MSVTLKPTITSILKIQRANAKIINALKPEGARGRAVKYGLTEGQRAAQAETHVDTGALKASHRMYYDPNGPKGLIYIDTSAANPRTGAKTSAYGPVEHARGDPHDFYARVERLHGKRISEGMIHVIYSDLPQ